MQNQPYVPVGKSKEKQTAQTVFVVALAVLGLLLLALWPSMQTVNVESTGGSTVVNSEAVNPELRLMERYQVQSVAPEARAAANPELAVHERYVAQKAALLATVEAPAFRTSAVNPELAAHERYVAAQAAVRATVEAPASLNPATNPELAAHERYVAEQAAVRATVEAPALNLNGNSENPQQSLPDFKQSR